MENKKNIVIVVLAVVISVLVTFGAAYIWHMKTTASGLATKEEINMVALESTDPSFTPSYDQDGNLLNTDKLHTYTYRYGDKFISEGLPEGVYDTERRLLLNGKLFTGILDFKTGAAEEMKYATMIFVNGAFSKNEGIVLSSGRSIMAYASKGETATAQVMFYSDELGGIRLSFTNGLRLTCRPGENAYMSAIINAFMGKDEDLQSIFRDWYLNGDYINNSCTEGVLNEDNLVWISGAALGIMKGMEYESTTSHETYVIEDDVFDGYVYRLQPKVTH